MPSSGVPALMAGIHLDAGKADQSYLVKSCGASINGIKDRKTSRTATNGTNPRNARSIYSVLGGDAQK